MDINEAHEKNSAYKPLVAFTLDVEPDNQWENHHNVDVTNVDYLDRLQALCERYNVKPTYLVTYAVATNERAVAVLRNVVERNHVEIGAHLHPWDNPPFMDNHHDVEYQAFPHDLPLPLFQEKMEMLTEVIGEAFPAPRCYRAGRWGFCAEHIRVLERLGYTTDMSVTPLDDRGDKFAIPPELGGKGGRDYMAAPLVPYHPDYADERRVGHAALVEVPLTANFTRRPPAVVRRIYPSLPSLMMRGLRKSRLLRPVWAQPTWFSLDELGRMLDVCLRDRHPVLNFTFHSSEVMPGGSPRFRTPEAIDRLYEKLERLLARLTWIPVRFVTLGDATDLLLADGAVARGD